MASSLGQRLRRPLDDRARKRAFVVAGVVLVVGILGVSQVRETGHAHRDLDTPALTARRPASDRIVGTQAGRSTDAVRAPKQAAPQSPQNALPAAQRRRALARARTFLTAYLRYETGRDSTTVRAQMQRTTTPGLAQSLTSRPPRQPAGDAVPIGRIATLQLDARSSASVGRVSAAIDRRGHLSALTLTLERHDGAWLVAEIG